MKEYDDDEAVDNGNDLTSLTALASSASTGVDEITSQTLPVASSSASSVSSSTGTSGSKRLISPLSIETLTLNGMLPAERGISFPSSILTTTAVPLESPHAILSPPLPPQPPPPPAVGPNTARLIDYVYLLISLVGGAWGGPLFALLSPTPPMLKAAWRLTVTTLMMLPGLAYDLKASDAALRRRWWASTPYMVSAGVLLGAHFCFFSYSVDHTSFSHVTFLVSVGPVMLVLGRVGVAVSSNFFGYPKVEGGSTAAAAAAAAATATATTIGPANGSVAAGRGIFSSNDGSEDKVNLSNANSNAEEDTNSGSRWDTSSISTPITNSGSPWDTSSISTPIPLSSTASFSILTPPRTQSTASSMTMGTKSDGGWAEDGTKYSSSRPSPSTLAPPLPSRGRGSNSPSPPPSPYYPFPTAQEIIGSLIAIIAVGYLASSRGSDAKDAAPPADPSPPVTGPTIRAYGVDGDIAAILTALSFTLYIVIGGHLRQWMPLWLYVTPLTATAMVTAMLSTVFYEGTAFFPPVGIAPGEEGNPIAVGGGSATLFGWLYSGPALGLSLAIAFIPGIVGHTLTNMALKRIPALTVSVAYLAPPLLTSFFGYAVGIAGVPSSAALIAAPLILVGVALVVTGKGENRLFRWVGGAIKACTASLRGGGRAAGH